MEIFESEDGNVVVKGDDDTYYFETEENGNIGYEATAYYSGEDKVIPPAVFDHLEREGYRVRPSEPKEYGLRLVGPYSRPQAAAEFGVESDDDVCGRVLDVAESGIRVEFEVESDGTTKVVALDGQELEVPLEL